MSGLGNRERFGLPDARFSARASIRLPIVAS
jgi:hypothetical protein